jgi:hypothetical protein
MRIGYAPAESAGPGNFQAEPVARPVEESGF